MKAQKKHMKRNNQSKYVKKQNMKQAGITLIALVVTIIVLLILAGVTIGMATSNTGIFKRASNAADTWNESRGKENAALASWEGAIDEHAGAGTNPNTSTGGAVNITKNGQKVDISQITSVYGEKVDYKPTTDQSGVYRIFYYDAAGDFGPAGTLYLKRDWTANDTKLDGHSSATSTTYTEARHTANGDKNALDTMKRMNKKWGEQRSTAENANEHEAMWLCDKTQWEKYVDSSKADYAIGSPSAEMYCASYNSVSHSVGNYTLGATYRATSAPGYIYTIGGTEASKAGTDADNDYWTGDNTVDYAKYNSMYCGQGGAKGDYRWWLGSPSAGASSSVCSVNGFGAILNRSSGGSASFYNYGDSGNNGVCPLVSLKSGVPLIIQ